MRSRVDPKTPNTPVRDAFSRGIRVVPALDQFRKPRPMPRRPNALRPSELRPSELRPSELRPSELRPSGLRRSGLRRGERPREDAPRSQPRPGDFGRADPRRVPVSRASEPAREKRGARPASPPPAERIRLPRCRRGDDRPSGAGRPKTADRPKRDDERPKAELRPSEEEEEEEEEEEGSG